MNEAHRIVVIGCSGAGALAAMMLKQKQPSLDVTILREEDEQGLLTRCATPHICCGDPVRRVVSQTSSRHCCAHLSSEVFQAM